jgi:hypothetical protein
MLVGRGGIAEVPPDDIEGDAPEVIPGDDIDGDSPEDIPGDGMEGDPPEGIPDDGIEGDAPEDMPGEAIEGDPPEAIPGDALEDVPTEAIPDDAIEGDPTAAIPDDPPEAIPGDAIDGDPPGAIPDDPPDAIPGEAIEPPPICGIPPYDILCDEAATAGAGAEYPEPDIGTSSPEGGGVKSTSFRRFTSLSTSSRLAYRLDTSCSSRPVRYLRTIPEYTSWNAFICIRWRSTSSVTLFSSLAICILYSFAWAFAFFVILSAATCALIIAFLMALSFSL